MIGTESDLSDWRNRFREDFVRKGFREESGEVFYRSDLFDHFFKQGAFGDELLDGMSHEHHHKEA